MIIRIPGAVKYGAYQGFLCAFAIFSSDRNQFPRSAAAVSMAAAFISVMSMDKQTPLFSIIVFDLKAFF